MLLGRVEKDNSGALSMLVCNEFVLYMYWWFQDIAKDPASDGGFQKKLPFTLVCCLPARAEYVDGFVQTCFGRIFQCDC